MGRRSIIPIDPHAECNRRIEHLQSQLAELRRQMIGLQPDEIARRMLHYYDINNEDDFYQWWHGIIDYVIELAKTGAEPAWDGMRANCPLCRQGVQSFMSYAEGYKLPEGLARHLRGEYNSEQCVVMKTAKKYVRSEVWAKVQAAKSEEHRLREEQLAKRRATEVQYDVDPTVAAKLLEEGLRSWRAATRNLEELTEAESRLRPLGFEERRNGLVVAWTRVEHGFIVYADLRATGRLTFKVFKMAQAPSKDGGLRGAKFVGEFDLLDSYKVDLRGKYVARLAQATKIPADAFADDLPIPAPHMPAKVAPDVPGEQTRSLAEATGPAERALKVEKVNAAEDWNPVIPGVYVVKPVGAPPCLRVQHSLEYAKKRAMREFRAGVETVKAVTLREVEQLGRAGVVIPVAARRHISYMRSK